MFSLLQIILLINTTEVPTINVLTHYDSQEVCETKLNETYKRNIEGGNKAEILKDDENKKFLKIEFNNEKSVSFWMCKQTIFYKDKPPWHDRKTNVPSFPNSLSHAPAWIIHLSCSCQPP